MADALDPRVGELVGIAAAVAGHCQPCFDFHYRKARELGVGEGEIRAAVRLARMVRAAGDRSMDEYVARGLREEAIAPVIQPGEPSEEESR